MFIKKSFQTALAIGGAAFIFGSSACSLSGDKSAGIQPGAATPFVMPTRDPNAVKYFESADELNRIKAVFAEKIGGEVKVIKLVIDENRVEMQAQDPKKPENVDEYEYRDGVMKPAVPVRLMGGGKLEDNLIKLNDVALEKIPELTREALERSKNLENPKILLVQTHLTTDGKPQILINVESTRKSAMLTCDIKGKVIEYRQF